MKLNAVPQHAITHTVLGYPNPADEEARARNLSNDTQKTVLQSHNDHQAAEKKALPPHIESLLAQQQKIRKQIREYKEQLIDVKTRLDMDEKIKQSTLKHLTAHLTQLHLQLVSVSQALHDALKKSGINDLTQLVDLLS
ncbi:hypothetical protein [Pseudoalteromonas sp. T1lg23B]|uniref:hypothetical protein n=1 Tax=Pseudoalteromonas sp. T1lg23B TaxID=2077097 RepID=UPI000CF6A62B|nr:hypothetical protein [Pseudoalteromonas sp. T1lg23B]